MPREGVQSRKGLTVLAVLHPRCVIVIPKSRLWASFIGRFTDCDFYIEQQSLPVKFTCAAWRQCMWLYEEYVSLRRDVEVIENGKETFTVTITACPEDKDESNSCLEEESTGYIFHLDGDGVTARQVLSALKRHYMFFTRKWIEKYWPSVLPSLNHPEMVKEFLKQLSGNDDLVKFLADIVTDQDFPRQHARLLQCVYDDYEAAALPKAVGEERKGTGELTMVPQSPPLRDFDSVSSCSRTGTDDSSAYSVSLTSAGPETLLKAQKGLESFDPPDSSTATAAGVGFMVEDVAGSGPETSVHKAVEGVVQVATTAEETENVSACNREVYALVEKYGRDMIMKILLGGRLPEWLRPPPTPTCAPVQCQSVELSGTVEPFAPVQVVAGSKEDHESSNTAESDMYRS